MKRILDFSIALALIVPSGVVIFLAGLLVAIEMKANPIFAQTRVGKERKPFTIYKLRTMSPGTAHVASHQASAENITKVGKIMRGLKIDELPQLVCVLRGHMSLVGPRPCLFNQKELICEREERGVFTVLPGITGLAQIQGVDMSVPVELAKLDAAYIADQSVKGDLKILWQTLTGHGRGDAVSQ